MTAVATENAAKLTAAERKAEREKLAPKFIGAVRKFSSAAIEFGQTFTKLVAELEGYFTVAEMKAGKLDQWIADTCGLSRASWKRYVQVADTLAEMPAEQVAVVQGNWSVDGMTELTRLDDDQRAKLVEQVGTKASTATIRKAAEKIKPRSVRATPDAAEKTATVVARIRPLIGTSDLLSVLKGAQMQLDHPKDDIPAAIHFILANPEPTPVESDIKTS